MKRRGSYHVETRAEFCKRYFEKEVSSYEKLSHMQGRYIPVFYGKYVIEYTTRKLRSDCQVNTVLVEVLEGCRLSQVNLTNYTSEQRKKICSDVLDICVTMHQRGILWPNVTADNFRISTATEVKAFGFAATYLADKSNPVNEKDTRALPLARVNEFLETLGFGNILKDLLDNLHRVAL